VVFVGNVTSSVNGSPPVITFNVSIVLKGSIGGEIQSVLNFYPHYFLQVGKVYEVYARFVNTPSHNQLYTDACIQTLINSPSDVFVPPTWLLLLSDAPGLVVFLAALVPVAIMFVMFGRRLKSAKGLTDYPRTYYKLKAASMMAIGASLLIFGILWIGLSNQVVNEVYHEVYGYYNTSSITLLGMQLLGLILATLGAGLSTYGYATRHESVQKPSVA